MYLLYSFIFLRLLNRQKRRTVTVFFFDPWPDCWGFLQMSTKNGVNMQRYWTITRWVLRSVSDQDILWRTVYSYFCVFDTRMTYESKASIVTIPLPRTCNWPNGQSENWMSGINSSSRTVLGLCSHVTSCRSRWLLMLRNWSDKVRSIGPPSGNRSWFFLVDSQYW